MYILNSFFDDEHIYIACIIKIFVEFQTYTKAEGIERKPLYPSLSFNCYQLIATLASKIVTVFLLLLLFKEKDVYLYHIY